MSVRTNQFGPETQNGTLTGLQPINTSFSSVAPLLPLTQVLTTTGETIIANPQLPSQPLTLPVPPYTTIEATPFDINASGYAIGTTGGETLTLKLYSGTSDTVGSNTLLGTSGAVAVGAATVPWMMVASVMFDSVSGKLIGEIGFNIGNTRVAPIALSNVITGINNEPTSGQTGEPILNFVLTATSSVTGMTVALYRFGAA